MAPLNDGYVKMANLAVISSHSVNGVSALHSDILKETVFNDFYTEMPEKFQNVTNGIAHRRWLNQSNPELASLLTEKIGDGYIHDAAQLEKFLEFKDDAPYWSSSARSSATTKSVWPNISRSEQHRARSGFHLRHPDQAHARI